VAKSATWTREAAMYEVILTGVAEQIGVLGQYDQITQQELTHGMIEAVKAIQWSSIQKAPKWTNALANHMQSRVMGVGSFIVGEVYSDASNPIYPLVMEYGRRAGAKPPPIDAIRPWVEDKLGDGSLAFVVARSIGRKGIKPHYFLRRAFQENRAAIVGMFGLVCERIAQRLSVNP
jgi:hypothetical protein